MAEAHPAPGAPLYRTPARKAELRRKSALAFVRASSLSVPTLLDTPDNRTYNDYEIQASAFFVLDAEGRRVFRSGRPPDGMRTEEVELALEKLVPPRKP